MWEARDGVSIWDRGTTNVKEHGLVLQDGFRRTNPVVSNGHTFYSSQASGFVVSQTYGPESKDLTPAWEVRE
jgi:hypothetical protein